MRDPGAAVRFREVLRALLERIAENPSQFPALDAQPASTVTIRRATLPRPFPYHVVFYARDGEAIVLAIAHGRRRPEYWSPRL
jgi:plasmid stabilization system protein ParE